MEIEGETIVLILGLLNMALILFLVSTGRRWIKVPFRFHRAAGFLLLLSASVHGILALLGL